MPIACHGADTWALRLDASKPHLGRRIRARALSSQGKSGNFKRATRRASALTCKWQLLSRPGPAACCSARGLGRAGPPPYAATRFAAWTRAQHGKKTGSTATSARKATTMGQTRALPLTDKRSSSASCCSSRRSAAAPASLKLDAVASEKWGSMGNSHVSPRSTNRLSRMYSCLALLTHKAGFPLLLPPEKPLSLSWAPLRPE